METIDFFKLQAKNLYRDYKTKTPYIDKVDGFTYYNYTPVYFDVDRILFEFDYDEDEDNLRQDRRGNWRVKGITPLADLNAALHTEFSDEEFDTVAGLVTRHFGHLPKRGESVQIANLRCQILRADSRRIHSILIEVLPELTSGGLG